jgi:PAS domain S-box-containing protein
MTTARLSLSKDIIWLILLLGLLGLTQFYFVTNIQAAQAQKLEEQYKLEQISSTEAAVRNMAKRIDTMSDALAKDGLSQARADELLLSDISCTRYGPNGIGYFYVLDRDYKIIAHATTSELVGKDLFSIVDSSGKNLGELLRGNLVARPFAWIEYNWENPVTKENGKKELYVQPAMRGRWLLCAGFYQGDLGHIIDKYKDDSNSVINPYRVIVFLAFMGLAAIFIAFTVLINISIRRIEKKLRAEKIELEQYKLILDESSLVSKTDKMGVITYVNDSFCETTGFTRDQAIGQNQNIERHPDTPLETFRDMWETIQSGKPWHGIIKNRKANGGWYYKRSTIVPLISEEGSIEGYISSGQDVTQLFELRRQLEGAFQTDPLSGLGNRIRLLEDIRGRADAWVALIDIENFSAINRNFTTNIGDIILKSLAASVFEYCQQNRYRAYRIYADTFAIMGGSDGRTTTAERYQGVRGRFKSLSADIEGQRVEVLIRIGFAARGTESFAFADVALARARKERKHAVMYEGEMELEPSLVENMRVLRTVNEALAADRVYPVFQPIARTEDLRVLKYECLMRIEDDAGRVILPDAFIAISKKTENYRDMTLKMIEKSVAAFSRRPEQFSINFTIEDLFDELTVEYLTSLVQKEGLQGRVIVEIVESEELLDFERAGEILVRLKTAGIGIAIDDFGSGYSNFEYLLRLSPDYIKIDRAIIQSITTDKRAAEMLQSIVTFAKNAGIMTIAEFIDSEALVIEMRRLGVDFLQGWLIGKGERKLLAIDPDLSA